MLKRKLEDKFNEWLRTGKNALLVTGARQTGKTYLIRELLKATKSDYVEFNLIRQPELVSLFESASTNDMQKFISRLTVATEKKLTKGKTIIFIDECQVYKDILTAIKFMVDDGTFRYVLSGSLLGVELRNLTSAPVGYLSVLKMYPLDFQEFLKAVGIKDETLETLRDCFVNRLPVDDFIHQRIMDAFYTYLVVGGMPQAVQSYIDENDFRKVSQIHKDIIAMYKQDFTHYEEKSTLKLIKTYDLIPSELNMKNKRYIFTDLDKNLKFDRYENSFNWLMDAGVALPVFNTTEPVIPLKINKQSNLFKLFMSDAGLLTTCYGRASQIKLLDKEKEINCGAIFENIVAQELTANGYDLYYFASKTQGELDFIIEYNGKVLPVEVKSGKDFTKHSALNNVLSNEDYKIEEAFVLSSFNIQKEGKVTYLPVYMTMFLNEDSLQLPAKPKLDLSDL
ncbi:ATP-binding protein [Treponema sp. C6A8]|uniref:ATP-binding protein n=1 Tax=Treponema sp. C6A8 TaxID=1410609 RepID=UPI0004888CA6|nr:AAA family ATPase [Treponema sp. C6A8]